LVNSAAYFPAPVALAIQSVVFRHPIAQSQKDVSGQWIAVLRQAIMRPFSIVARIH
jgi:hypothetical protein